MLRTVSLRHALQISGVRRLRNWNPSRRAFIIQASYRNSVVDFKERMWTRGDKYHVHGISGALCVALVFAIMFEWCKNDAMELLSSSQVPVEDWTSDWTDLASLSIVFASTCALSGIPLAKRKGWRKLELSFRSVAFQFVMTWQLCRLVSETLSPYDNLSFFACLLPFAWHTLMYLYIFFFTGDDKRSVLLVWFGILLFELQLFPTAIVLNEGHLHQLRQGLLPIWEHSLFGLIWLLNWSTFGASLKARNVIKDDQMYRKWFLIRPSALWVLMYALDMARFHPFASNFDYFSSRAVIVV